MQTTPWNPVSLLKVVLKNKGMSARWCRKDILEKRRLEGWIPVSYKDLEAESSLTMQDGESLDTTVQRRGLILCKMPKERIEARNQYYASLTQGAMKGVVSDLERDVNVKGYTSGVTGKMEIYEGGKE